nr:RIP metalloprotease RseP [Acidimicrobiia bacterium]
AEPSAEAGSTPDGGAVPHAGLRLAALLAGLVALGLWNPWMLVVIMAIVVMITLHEFGHYITAKRAGMKVTEFFLFFGPKVWSIKRGETEYGIKCIPAGAYVKIIGMHNLEEVPPADEGRTYRQKSFGRRISVAVAGSTMHFLLAFAFIFVSLAAVGQPAGTLDPGAQGRDWRIGSVEEGTGAAAAGLEAGDKVVRIDGQAIGTFEDLRTVSQDIKGQTVPVVYERDGQQERVDVTLEPFYSWRVARVVAGTGPAEAGLEVGDEITSIDGTDTRALADLDALLRKAENSTVPVELERTDDAGNLRAAEAELRVESLVLAGSEGYLGVSREQGPEERLGPLDAVVQTPTEFANIVSLSVQGLGSFFSPQGVSDFAGQVGDARDKDAGADGPAVPTSDKTSATLLEGGSGGGPGENRVLSIYGLVRIGSDAGKVDPASLITLFVLVNIFIGVFNLVPLLPFDGGHVLIAVYEKIQERRLNRKRYFTDVARLLPLTYVVVLALGMLFISSLYLDIVNPIQAQ